MLTIASIAAVGFATLCIVLLFIILNLYRKLIWHEKYLLNLDTKLVNIFKTISKIDQRKMFESDDEVGQLWDQIKKVILELEKKLIG